MPELPQRGGCRPRREQRVGVRRITVRAEARRPQGRFVERARHFAAFHVTNGAPCAELAPAVRSTRSRVGVGESGIGAVTLARRDMNAAPEVTVIIPTRDRWALLERALWTVLGQHGVELEVVIVDDGSASPMPEPLAAQLPPRVRLIELPASGGVARARNHAISEARGEWVAFLDDDDVWAPDKLRRQLDVARPDVGLVYSGAVLLDDAARMIGVRRTPPAHELRFGLLDTNLVGGPSGVIARTALVSSVGGFDEAFGVLADWDLWLALFQVTGAEACPGSLVGYTVHGQNMHLGDPARLRRELRMLRQKHAALSEAAGIPLAGQPFLRWLVRRYRGAGMRAAAARVYLTIGVRHRSPRDLARAPVMLLGERSMGVGRGGRPRGPASPVWNEPDWLLDLRGR